MKLTKTIWNGIYGKTSVVVLLFCCSLLFGSSVKASNVDIQELEIDGYNNVTIPSYTGTGMLICSMESPHYYSSYSLTADSVDMTLIDRISGGYIASTNGNGAISLFYLNSPVNNGVIALSGNFLNSGRYIDIDCVLATNIDLDNPFINGTKVISGNFSGSGNYNTSTVGNTILGFWTAGGNSWGGNITGFTSSNYFQTNIYFRQWNPYIGYGHGWDITNGAGNTIYTQAGSGEMYGFNAYYLELTYKSSIPPSNDYIVPIGQQPFTVTTGQPANWDVYYNIYDKFASLGGSCSYTIEFVSDTGNTYGEHSITSTNDGVSVTTTAGHFIFNEIIGGDIGETTGHFQLVVTCDQQTFTYPASEINIAVLPIIIEQTGYLVFLHTNNWYVDTTSAGNVDLPFQYDICDVNYTGGNFYLKNLDTGGLTSFHTPLQTRDGSDCKGIDVINITWAKDITQFIPSQIVFIASSSEMLYYSQSFNLIFRPKAEQLPECPNLPKIDTTHTCDGLNLTSISGSIVCGVKKGFLDLTDALIFPSCGSITGLYNNYNRFKHSFPFNMVFDFTDSVNLSIDNSLTATSTAQSIDIPFIRQTATSSEYYMLPVISSSTMINTIGQNNYNTFRTTMGYVWWVLFAGISFLIVIL